MQWKFTLFAVYLLKSHIREKSGSWDRGQNALSQSDCGVFKSNYIFRENDEIAFSLHVDFKSYKFKVDWKLLGWAWSKMGVTSLITRLKNWLYLKSELLELADFFASTSQESYKLLQWFLGGRGQKCTGPFSSWDSKICCILRMGGCIKLIFGMLIDMP